MVGFGTLPVQTLLPPRMSQELPVKQAFGPLTLQFLKDLGNRLRQATGDENSNTYLIQRLSVSVQRGNAASVPLFLLYP